MKAHVPNRAKYSQRQINEMHEIAKEEFSKMSDDITTGVARRILKMVCQAMYEEYGWTAKGFLRVLQRVMALDAESDTNAELMTHIDGNLKRLGYEFDPEDPTLWIVK